MKKKILALFLVFTFVCAIGVGSFANTGDYNVLRLSPGKTSTIRLYPKDMDSRDDDLIYSVYFESGTDSRCKLEIIDRTAGNKVIETRYPRVKSSMVQIKDIIDPTHKYKIVLTNTGTTTIRGGFMVAVE